MELIYTHSQEKKQSKNNSNFHVEIKLYKDSKTIRYNSIFHFEYARNIEKKYVRYNYVLDINLETGEFRTKYGFDNRVSTNKSFEIEKKNNFISLNQLISDGYAKGERTTTFWGVKYDRAKQEIYKIIKKHLNFETKIEHNEKFNDLYVLVVNFYLYKKKIKYHNNIYHHIKYDFPRKKYLQKNDNNYLPSVLDGYGIKSNYLITELNVNNNYLYITSLNYICKLFGDNYIDYIKKFNWQSYCQTNLQNKKIHQLKNEHEKKSLVKVLKDLEKDNTTNEPILKTINNLFEIRKELESKNLKLDFKAKNSAEFDYITELWMGTKLHYQRGHKLKYKFQENFLDDIERDIIVDNRVYNVKILKTEDDFRIEGYIMKNCMNKQFSYGSIYIFIVIICGNKRINVQYNKNQFMLSYGKANTQIPDNFNKAIAKLSARMIKYTDLQWIREKYEDITN